MAEKTEKKKVSIKTYLLIFFIIHLVLAFFLNTTIHIGTNSKTGKFGIWTSVKEISMQDKIGEEVQPDVYIADLNREIAKHNAEIEAALLHNYELDMAILYNANVAKHNEEFPDDPMEFLPVGEPRVVNEPRKPHDPAHFTYGSSTLYNFFYKLFHEGSPYKFFGGDSAITNFRLWRMLLYIDIFLILLAIYLRKKLRFIPTKAQIIAEMAYNFLTDLVNETLGEKGKKFIAYFVTLFFFIWFSNQSGLLPIPGISEPTRNLNTTLGLGCMVMAVVQYCAMRKKGVKNWAKSFCEPMVFMAPLNIVGEISKVVSIAFRLFGNIFGGAIIIVVVSSLTYYAVVPVGLNMFFVMFAGTIQAFVFTMLAMTYLALEIVD